jgi:hypothetical protein
MWMILGVLAIVILNLLAGHGTVRSRPRRRRSDFD